MRAWYINDDQTMTLTDLAPPEPAAGEVRISVRAVGVNRADLLQCKGRYPAPPGVAPDIPGLEYAGVVEATGGNVTQWEPGDRVMGLVPGAAYAESLVTHSREVLPAPPGLALAQAATIPEAFLTAYRALFLEGNLQPGQWCLIRPATASVGLAATQLAHALGARPIGSSRNREKLRTAQQMGLAATVDEGPAMAEQALALTGKQGLAVILDMLGPDWPELLPALRTEGCLVLIGLLAGARTSLDLSRLLMKRHRLRAMTMRSQPLEQRIEMAQSFIDHLLPLFEDGRLQPLPLEPFAFDKAPAAHRHLAENDFSGKRVLVLD